MVLKNKLITAPTGQVVSLPEFKSWIRWDLGNNDEDTVMESCIEAATLKAEAYTRRIIRSSSWHTYMDSFPDRVEMEIVPIDLDSLVVKYYDDANTLQTLSASEYFVHDNGEDDYLEMEFVGYGTMPTLYDRYNAVQIEFDAGYTVVPELIKTAIKKYAAILFENREGGDKPEMTMNFYADLFPYKML